VIRLKTAAEIDRIKESCQLLGKMFDDLVPRVKPGVTTKELDEAAKHFIVSHGGIPAFLDYEGYPATLCASVNEVVIHGIPSDKKLVEGDIIGLDCGINLNGFMSDAAITVPVGKISAEAEKLLSVTRECLDRAIAAVKPGARIHDISRAVYGLAVSNHYGVVRQYCGHGVGFENHEDPQIPNYVSPGPNPRIIPGMVIAIEPMINLGTGDVKDLDDGWTVVTLDHKISAHYEHTVGVYPDGHVEVLTYWNYPKQ
jgi:methionyl aminopeptidase